jgi:Flp pilus assembly protein TadD
MFSSRNIHFAILGVILGASSGYVFAFYHAQKSEVPPALSSSQAEAELPAGHPDVNNDGMLEAMKKAVDTDPTQPEIVKRYAMALFDAGHFDDASKWFEKAVALEPNNVEVRSMYGAVLWRIGNKNSAAAQLEAALRIDPRNVASLHGLALLALEKQDIARASQYIKQLEAIEPTYSQLPELRSRLEAAGGTK